MNATHRLQTLLGIATLVAVLAGCQSWVDYRLEADRTDDRSVETQNGVVLVSAEERSAVEAAIPPLEEMLGYNMIVSTWVANLGNEGFTFKPSDVMLVVNTSIPKRGPSLVIYRGDDDTFAYSDAFRYFWPGGQQAIDPPLPNLDGTAVLGAVESSEALATAVENVVSRRKYDGSTGVSSYLFDSRTVPPNASVAGGVGIAQVGWYWSEQRETKPSADVTVPVFSAPESATEAFSDPALLYELTDGTARRGPSPDQYPEMRTWVSMSGPEENPAPEVRLYIRTAGEIHSWDLTVFAVNSIMLS